MRTPFAVSEPTLRTIPDNNCLFPLRCPPHVLTSHRRATQTFHLLFSHRLRQTALLWDLTRLAAAVLTTNFRVPSNLHHASGTQHHNHLKNARQRGPEMMPLHQSDARPHATSNAFSFPHGCVRHNDSANKLQTQTQHANGTCCCH